MADTLGSSGMERGGMGRGGLDRYLAPPASDHSRLPKPDPAEAADSQRALDCAGKDANEPVCEIANAEFEERGEDSAT